VGGGDYERFLACYKDSLSKIFDRSFWGKGKNAKKERVGGWGGSPGKSCATALSASPQHCAESLFSPAKPEKGYGKGGTEEEKDKRE